MSIYYYLKIAYIKNVGTPRFERGSAGLAYMKSSPEGSSLHTSGASHSSQAVPVLSTVYTTSPSGIVCRISVYL